jgi:DNA-binding NarL/FixJ family response regulator
MPRTRVLLADDHTIVAEGLEALLRDHFDLAGVVHDGLALLEAAVNLKPDVVVTDVSMPLMNGLDAVRRLHEQEPNIAIVVLTMHRDAEIAAEAFRAGASGYVLKSSAGEELVAAIMRAAEGKSYVTNLMSTELVDLLVRGESGKKQAQALSGRQREVLKLIADGKTMKEVASILGISPRTAETHKYEIMQLLGLKTTAALIQYAVKSGLTEE